MTATIETMLTRSSIRAYTDEKLTDDELILLKKAALSAPTAMNRNDQRFVFVTDGAVISKVEQEVIAGVKAKGDTVFLERILSRGGKVAYDAPLLVIIFGKPSRYAGIVPSQRGDGFRHVLKTVPERQGGEGSGVFRV